MRIFYLCILSCLFYQSLLAQFPQFKWANSISGDGILEAKAVTANIGGSVFVTGGFEGTVDFDPGPDEFNLTSNGGADIFLAKYFSNGEFQWAYAYGGPQDDMGLSLSFDVWGNVYLAGSFQGTVDFDPDPQTVLATATGPHGNFIQMYDANANLRWTRTIDDPGGFADIHIEASRNGGATVSGSFTDTMHFINSVPDLVSAPGSIDGFLVFLGTQGGLGGASSYSSLGVDYLNGSARSPYGFYFTGADSSRYLLAKRASSQNSTVWTKTATGAIKSKGLCVDNDGSVFVLGNFSGTAHFDSSATLTAVGQDDLFIQKVDTSGQIVWLKQIGSAGQEQAYAIDSDYQGNIYITASFSGTLDLDPNAPTNMVASAGATDFFISKLNTDGDLVWGKRIGAGGDDFAVDLDIDELGGIITAGNYKNTVDFDPNNGVFTLTSVDPTNDIFVQKWDDVDVGIEKIALFDAVSIYPNPNHGQAQLNLGELTNVSLRITNINGQVIHEKQNIKAATYSIEIPGPAGMYFVTILADGLEQHYRVVRY